jgi:hypothetical protein
LKVGAKRREEELHHLRIVEDDSRDTAAASRDLRNEGLVRQVRDRRQGVGELRSPLARNEKVDWSRQVEVGKPTSHLEGDECTQTVTEKGERHAKVLGKGRNQLFDQTRKVGERSFPNPVLTPRKLNGADFHPRRQCGGPTPKHRGSCTSVREAEQSYRR